MKRALPLAFSLLAAAVLIGAGCVLGQPGMVLSKAARICLECVGIG